MGVIRGHAEGAITLKRTGNVGPLLTHLDDDWAMEVEGGRRKEEEGKEGGGRGRGVIEVEGREGSRKEGKEGRLEGSKDRR